MKAFPFILLLLFFFPSCSGDNEGREDPVADDNPGGDNDASLNDDDAEIPMADIEDLGIQLFVNIVDDDDDNDTYPDSAKKKEGEETPDPFQPPQMLVHYNGISWQNVNEYQFTRFNGFWGLSPDNFWASAVDYMDWDLPEVIHYNHGKWGRERLTSYPNVEIRGISGSSDEDIYLAGFNEDNNYVILHYDGQFWDLERQSDIGATLEAIWVSEEGEVFAVGIGRGLFYPKYGPLIVHFDGQEWTETILPVSGVACYPNDVWGSSADSVYLVGYCHWGEDNISMPLFLHYDGLKWSIIPTDIDPTSNIEFEHIRGLSDDKIYITDWMYKPVGMISSRIYRYNGKFLEDLEMPRFVDGYNVIHDLWVSPKNQVFIAGPFPGGFWPPETGILMYDQGKWFRISGPERIYEIIGFVNKE